MRVFKSKNSKLNMCDKCFNDFSSCKPTICEFGDGVGNDNVIACSEYIGKPHKDIEIDTSRGIVKRQPIF